MRVGEALTIEECGAFTHFCELLRKDDSGMFLEFDGSASQGWASRRILCHRKSCLMDHVSFKADLRPIRHPQHYQ